MIGLPSTKQITEAGEYMSGKREFFKNFPAAWDLVRSQVLKLETRLSYNESGNPSYDALQSQGLAEAIRLLPHVKKSDDQLYESLLQRRVDFVRCRPLGFPLNEYLQWELAAYTINATKGERIFCCNYNQIDEVFSENASHDFMVFDARIAFIYEQDASGLTIGGWQITDVEGIGKLIGLFGYVKAHCRPYDMFMPPTPKSK